MPMNAIEHVWLRPEHTHRPLVVFLHEGLGSVALWRNFPEQLCEALDVRGLVFSRAGYGQSTPRQLDESWTADFLHRQAMDVLPAFLASLGIDTECDPPILFGHSDGATIALIYAATYPSRVRSMVALAPHVMVEDVTLASIRTARAAYKAPDSSLKRKLARYHADVDSAFYGWCDVWLSSAFRSFDIRPLLKRITCPLLAIQGLDDAYGTMAQIDEIVRQAPHAQRLQLAHCGHSPHVDQLDAVIAASHIILG